MKYRTRILFITHDANRAGAQLVLLRFLHWMRENADFDIDILLRKSGPLAVEYKAVASQSFIWQPPLLFYRLADRVEHPTLRQLWFWLSRRRLLRRLHKRNYALIYANSSACTDILTPIHDVVQAPTILRVAELETAFHRYCEPTLLAHWLIHADRIIAVSDLVRDNLINRHQVTSDKIHKIPGFPPSNLPIESVDKNIALRIKLGIPQNAFVVGGSGMIHWCKGTDLFIQVAQQVLHKNSQQRPAHFVWIGGQRNSLAYREMLYDIEQLGIAGQVHLVGMVPNPQDYYEAFDLLLMTSREDSFPISCLEAGQVGCPIICFANGVGSTEFVNDTNGAVVPYMDVVKMTAAVLRFYEDEALLREASEAIRLAVQPYTLEKSATKILALLNELIN